MGMNRKLIDVLDSFMIDDDCLSNEQIAEILVAHDIVPVVRCKDCKSWKCLREDRGLCKHPTFTLDDDTIDSLTEPDDFCSYGERKDDV